MPAGGRRHELGDTCGSLGADSHRIEATFLPDHARKELDRKGILGRRLLQGAANVIWGERSRGRLFAGRGRMSAFPIGGCWRSRACLCVGRRIRQGEGASK